jgi:hypothetical protein
VGEIRQQARVEVVGAVGKVGRDLMSSVKVTVVEPCPENGCSELVLVRTLVVGGAMVAGSWSLAALGSLRSDGSREG